MARIALENVEGVATEALEDIAETADLPPGDIFLIVGDPLLADDLQAFAIPRAFVEFLGDIAGLENHLDAHWDCGVIVGSRWASQQPAYPAYFAYLLGHEFGHATTMIRNLPLAVYEALLIADLPQASGKKWRWDETPHEVRYDQFGLAVSEAVYGREALLEEIEGLIEIGREGDLKRLKQLLTLEPRADLGGLRKELAEFLLPYKDELLTKWAGDLERGHIGMLRFLRDPSALWDIS